MQNKRNVINTMSFVLDGDQSFIPNNDSWIIKYVIQPS